MKKKTNLSHSSRGTKTEGRVKERPLEWKDEVKSFVAESEDGINRRHLSDRVNGVIDFVFVF